MLARTAPSVGSQIVAVLGPTNTGKTHRCIERLLTHETGMVGLPLRLLAREVYGRVVELTGHEQVALVTGEEKRLPRGARYFICTVEAMPLEREVDFLAIDEIQLVAHSTRGHVFTDRLLHARGRRETWFLGSDTCRHLIEELVPTARFETYRRLSQLRHAGPSSLGRLPAQSAVVGFSVPQVYELAERIRVRKGGAAVVLGALSPKTRNAQVELFQQGKVNYLVATDAIGMGLNMNVSHVAFAGLRKFDGRKERALSTGELAQVAGRAGRHIHDGTFGTLRPCPPLADEVARAVEEHRHERLRFAFYRNTNLDFSNLSALLETLAAPPPHPSLRAMPEVDDHLALRTLSARSDVQQRLGPDTLPLLWEVCQIPDYRKLMPEVHANLLGEVFTELVASGRSLGNDWMQRQMAGLEQPAGDVDSLVLQLSFVRTFAYLSQHGHWLQHPTTWRAHTRILEDNLSDALHERLLQRFVSKEGTRRGPMAPRARTPSSAESVARSDFSPAAGHPFAQLVSLRRQLSGAAEPNSPTPSYADLLTSGPERFGFKNGCLIVHDEAAIGRLVPGPELRRPAVRLHEPFRSARGEIQRRLLRLGTEFGAELERALPPEALPPGPARGIAYQLSANLGTLKRSTVESLLSALEPDARELLERRGVIFGQRYVWLRPLLGARALSVRWALCAAWEPALRPLPFAVHRTSYPASVPAAIAESAGFSQLGPLLVRCDIVERALQLQRAAAPDAQIASLLGCRMDELEYVLAPPRRRRRRRRSRPRARAPEPARSRSQSEAPLATDNDPETAGP